MKISKLEETLANARLIDESQLDSSKILVLSKVKIKNLMNNMELEYQLVAESEANFTVSFADSPELPSGSIMSGWIHLTPEDGEVVCGYCDTIFRKKKEE